MNSLELLAGIFLAAVIEFAADLLSALAVRTFEWLLDRAEIATPLFAFLTYVSFGAAAGFLSALLLPHPLVHRPRVPGISLVVSPTLAGGNGLGYIPAAPSQQKGHTKSKSFTYGFAFALGMATVRFFLVKPI